MSENENGNPRPDGISVALGPLGGTYYWNPGSPTAPAVTLTGTLGLGGGGVQGVFLRKGMTSGDTLGYGASGTMSTIVPSATVNASIPDRYGIPQPWNARVSSVETGIALPGFGVNYTMTPQQVATGVANLLRPVTPAMGPDDELSSFARTLQSGFAAVGPSSAPPIRFVSSHYPNTLGDGMDGWQASTSDLNSPQPAPSSPAPDEPGGLLGMLLDHLRND